MRVAASHTRAMLLMPLRSSDLANHPSGYQKKSPRTSTAFIPYDKKDGRKSREVEKLERARCQDREHIVELREAVQQERAQTLNMMERLNAGAAEKAELEEEMVEIQTQLVRHKD